MLLAILEDYLFKMGVLTFSHEGVTWLSDET